MKNYLSRKDDFNFNMFDNFFDDFFAPIRQGSFNEVRTDIKETKDGYELKVDMPGFDKKDISIELDNGYLTLTANRNESEEDEKSYLRRERSFSLKRSFFVGDNVKEEDIKAKYNNGTLELLFPKDEVKKLPKHTINID